MVTKSQIAQLSKRIDEIADRLGATVKQMYTVYLDFGEDDETYYQRYPDQRGRRHEGVVLRFGTGAEKFVRIPRPE
jgi:hypothetical protein